MPHEITQHKQHNAYCNIVYNYRQMATGSIWNAVAYN